VAASDNTYNVRGFTFVKWSKLSTNSFLRATAGPAGTAESAY